MKRALAFGFLLCLGSPWLSAAPPTRAAAYVTDAVALATDGWAEVTVAAFGPGEHPSCSDGRLFFASGASVQATTLDGEHDLFWTASLEETYPPRIIYDNHLVKLKSGALLMTFEGATWSDNLDPHPRWWEWTVEYPAKGFSRPGARAAIWLFRSTDCGETWSALPPIDAAKLEVPATRRGEPVAGLCGTPRRIVDDGAKKAKLGGWDGHLLHADPYSGHLFLSTPCYYGAGEVGEGAKQALVLRSTDEGSSWSVRGHIGAQGGFRDPLASRPDRVAYVYQRDSSVRVATFPAAAPWFELWGSQEVRRLSAADETLPAGSRYLLNTNVYRIRGATRSAEGFLVSVPVFIDGGLAHVLYDVDPSGADARVIDTLRAGAWSQGRNHTFHGTFVPGLPDDPKTLNAFYWVESDYVPEESSYAVRFQVYADTTPILETPGTLTLANGTAYTYPFEPDNGGFVGDYMGGAAYRGTDGSRNFVASWSESGRLHFNTITVRFDAIRTGGRASPSCCGPRCPPRVRSSA